MIISIKLFSSMSERSGNVPILSGVDRTRSHAPAFRLTYLGSPSKFDGLLYRKQQVKFVQFNLLYLLIFVFTGVLAVLVMLSVQKMLSPSRKSEVKLQPVDTIPGKSTGEGRRDVGFQPIFLFSVLILCFVVSLFLWVPVLNRNEWYPWLMCFAFMFIVIIGVISVMVKGDFSRWLKGISHTV